MKNDKKHQRERQYAKLRMTVLGYIIGDARSELGRISDGAGYMQRHQGAMHLGWCMRHLVDLVKMLANDVLWDNDGAFELNNLKDAFCDIEEQCYNIRDEIGQFFTTHPHKTCLA